MDEDGNGNLDFFKLIPYGTNFRTVKKSLFSKKKFEIRVLLEWQASVIKIALLKTTSNSQAKTLFKLILGFMSDRQLSASENKMKIGATIAGMGIGKENVPMRDEIYCQVCKQVTFNPSTDATFEGWKLMRILVNYFPPSRELTPYMIEFYEEHVMLNKEYNGEVPDYARYCLKQLEKIARVGALGRVPTTEEIEGLYNSPLISIFGSTLYDIMDRQQDFAPESDLPLIMTALAVRVLELDGQHTEGIFRIPGDAQQVAAVRVSVENSVYDFTEIQDAHVPASSLKLWMRELEEPIIPGEFYDEAIEYARDEDHEQSIMLVEKLPELNRRVTHYVIQYLRCLAKDEFSKITMMTVINLAMVFAPNFLRCPSDDPAVIFDTQKHQQTFVKHLIEHMEFDTDHGFEHYL
jgi:hypothetical protein